MLAEDERIVFVGQAVMFGGQRAHETFSDIPEARRIEMPVAEDFQLGFCTGLALQGKLPVSFFPRYDFLICASNQLINHLDKMDAKVIIRTAVGANKPLDPGPQHTQDHTKGLRYMLDNIEIIELNDSDSVMSGYYKALASPWSSIVVEYMRLY